MNSSIVNDRPTDFYDLETFIRTTLGFEQESISQRPKRASSNFSARLQKGGTISNFGSVKESEQRRQSEMSIKKKVETEKKFSVFNIFNKKKSAPSLQNKKHVTKKNNENKVGQMNNQILGATGEDINEKEIKNTKGSLLIAGTFLKTDSDSIENMLEIGATSKKKKKHYIQKKYFF